MINQRMYIAQILEKAHLQIRIEWMENVDAALEEQQENSDKASEG